jgi:hypothetical protein
LLQCCSFYFSLFKIYYLSFMINRQLRRKWVQKSQSI